MNRISLGLDIGSTTIKSLAIDQKGTVLFHNYERHNAQVRERVLNILADIQSKLGDVETAITLTGSIGMGVSERYGFPFIQEVVASTKYMKAVHPEVKTMIDIGGEDAKVVFFHENQSPDLRMNGNCAGGTGAFIDQMAILLDMDNDEMSRRALESKQHYAIASRCGVFCKTDIQNLTARNVDINDIAASIFHAVAVQTVTTLSHGQDMVTPLLFCGGPLTFLPALRKAFTDYMHISPDDIVLPEKSNLIPAWGAAIHANAQGKETKTISRLVEIIQNGKTATYRGTAKFKALFNSEAEHKDWQAEKLKNKILTAPLKSGIQNAWLGIDSGSTTTKIVVTDEQKRILYSYYSANKGNPIGTFRSGLEDLQSKCKSAGTELRILGSCSTGYGEDLVKAAFGLQNGIIETIAHYLAARHIKKDVSFILDIGGQDMKAIFVSDGVINHIEINEACSSGCGTFLETFAKSMGYEVKSFADCACESQLPCDLGTRCTIFMNSKVKQVLREGATINDISAGLSYSVINNCLHKVLKIKRLEELGDHIVVQGGTMHNDAVCRAFELLIGKKVFRSDRPELMGALGCALYAQKQGGKANRTLADLLDSARYETKQLQCRGCENQCVVNRYTFGGGNVFYSGNKCEKVFNNKGGEFVKGRNLYEEKLHLLFDRPNPELPDTALTIGVPRVLNMFEEYPFWHALFSTCGIRVVLSEPSNYHQYERGVKHVMSDNICFPAKLAHSHILNLMEDKRVDRIFFPYVVFERQEKGQNSFNCPIVSGYSEVIRNSMNLTVPMDSPVFSFKNKKVLQQQCSAYLKTLGVKKGVLKRAFESALAAQIDFEDRIAEANLKVLEENRRGTKRLVILLAGRPYHSDQLVQHKISDMVCGLGVDVITDDVVRKMDLKINDVHFVSQWSYPEHILKAAKWAANQDENVQFIEMTSFGCGPDSFMLDEIHSLLKRHGKALTQLKIDDVCNIGSLKLRVRSVVDSLKLNLSDIMAVNQVEPFVTTPDFTVSESLKHHKIIVPYFTQFITPLIPPFMKLAGYDFEVLPMSDVDSGDYGLKYANNEICYPATLIVGDVIKAFDTKRYNPEETAVAITQTGGQCRATNYISLIKKALVEAGYGDVPVVSLAFSKNVSNYQPGFQFNWRKIMNIAFSTMLYSDAIAKFYFSAAPREKEPGAAVKLRDKYLEMARSSIERNQSKELMNYLVVAAKDFNRICVDKECPRVGVVGEIYLKFNPYAQRNLTNWLLEHGIEIEPPMLTQFFLQSFVNQDVKHATKVEKSSMPKLLRDSLHYLVRRRINRCNKACSAFRFFHPFDDIYEIAQNAKEVITLNAQFGEGWLLPGEVATMAQHGINHVVSLQPFGCIANHIISRGIEKKIHELYPQINFLSLDFDSGVSDVNVTNRMLLFINDLLEKNK